MADDVKIDLQAIKGEVDNLSDEKLREELLSYKVRQKKQQKKQQGSGAQKAYQLKQRERMKAIKERAKALGIYDELNDKANELAEEELAKENVEEEVGA